MATPKPHPIRVHDVTWANAQERAAREGRTVSAAVNEFLEQYGGTERERRERRAPALASVSAED